MMILFKHTKGKVMHILIDLDNVLLNSFYKKGNQTFFYWTQHLEKDLGIDPKTLGQLFTKNFLLKKSDEVYDYIRKYLSDNAYSISIDTFLDYWLEHDLNLNESVWTWVLNNYKLKKHTFFIASDQSCVRMTYLLNKFPLWKEVFKNIFTSSSLGVCKNNPLFFQKVLSEIKAEPTDVCLIDDNLKNIDTAKGVNIKTILFSGVSSLPPTL